MEDPCLYCYSFIFKCVVFLSGKKFAGFLHFICLHFHLIKSEREGWDPTNHFSVIIFLCLFQVRTWISNVICCSLFYFQ